MLSVQKKVGLTIGISAFLVATVNTIDLTVVGGSPFLRSLSNPLVYTLLFASFIPLLTAIRDARPAKAVQVMILLGLGLVATVVNPAGDLTGICSGRASGRGSSPQSYSTASLRSSRRATSSRNLCSPA